MGADAKDPVEMHRFFNEARAVDIINHPGRVQVSDFGSTPEGSAYLVMEFLSGNTLADRIKRLGRLPVADALQQILTGMVIPIFCTWLLTPT